MRAQRGGQYRQSHPDPTLILYGEGPFEKYYARARRAEYYPPSFLEAVGSAKDRYICSWLRSGGDFSERTLRMNAWAGKYPGLLTNVFLIRPESTRRSCGMVNSYPADTTPMEPGLPAPGINSGRPMAR